LPSSLDISSSKYISLAYATTASLYPTLKYLLSVFFGDAWTLFFVFIRSKSLD